MDISIQSLAIVFAILVWVFTIWAAILYDRLAAWSYQNDPVFWRKLGRPQGLIRKVSSDYTHASNITESFKVFCLIFKRVEVFGKENKTKTLLNHVRIFALLSFLSGSLALLLTYNIPN